jgi:hypothetical protein
VSIFEETGGGLAAVGHDRSLELFYDRYEVIARFVALINEDPPPRRVLYLHGLGGNGKSLLLRYLAARCCVRVPQDEWERVRRLPADALLPIQLMRVGQDMFDALDKRLDDVFTRRRAQRRLPRADAEEILSLAPEPDLIEQMPQLFATDLRGAVGEQGKHERVVLLFDTHEAFFGEAIADPGTLVHADFLMRDEWLRSLLGHLPLEAGVVAVLAGRIRPPWGSAPVAAIPHAFVDARPVGSLATEDALAYLAKAASITRSCGKRWPSMRLWDRVRCTRISWVCARMWRGRLSVAVASWIRRRLASRVRSRPSSWIWRGGCWPGCLPRWSTRSWR